MGLQCGPVLLPQQKTFWSVGPQPPRPLPTRALRGRARPLMLLRCNRVKSLKASNRRPPANHQWLIIRESSTKIFSPQLSLFEIHATAYIRSICLAHHHLDRTPAIHPPHPLWSADGRRRNADGRQQIRGGRRRPWWHRRVLRGKHETNEWRALLDWCDLEKMRRMRCVCGRLISKSAHHCP